MFKFFKLLPTAANPHWDKADSDSATSWAPYHLYNIGNNRVEMLMHFVEVLGNCLGKKAKKNYKPMQGDDIENTYAKDRLT